MHKVIKFNQIYFSPLSDCGVPKQKLCTKSHNLSFLLHSQKYQPVYRPHYHFQPSMKFLNKNKQASSCSSKFITFQKNSQNDVLSFSLEIRCARRFPLFEMLVPFPQLYNTFGLLIAPRTLDEVTAPSQESFSLPQLPNPQFPDFRTYFNNPILFRSHTSER